MSYLICTMICTGHQNLHTGKLYRGNSAKHQSSIKLKTDANYLTVHKLEWKESLPSLPYLDSLTHLGHETFDMKKMIFLKMDKVKKRLRIFLAFQRYQ
jgi:hypothetical protein